MAIDISGEWWRGDSADDIAGYLEELGPGGGAAIPRSGQHLAEIVV